MFRLSTIALLAAVLVGGPAKGQDADDSNVAERAAAAAREKLVERKLNEQAERIAELEVELARAKKEAELIKLQSLEEIDAVRKALEKTREALDESREAHAKVRDEAEKRIDELVKQLEAAGVANRKLSNRIADADGWGTRASDGKLTAFDAETGIGRVPFGSKDGAVPKMRFLVGAPPGTEATSVLTVTKVLGPHASEVKLLFEAPDPNDQPAAGDDLYAPWWRPGTKTHFAVAGRLDFDGDGRADNRTITDFVASQGGVVDVHVNEEGFVLGEPTLDTRFLILGEVDDPTAFVLPEDRDRAERLLRKTFDLKERMDRMGVRTVRLEEFLRMTGGDPEGLTEAEREAEIRRLIEKLERDANRSPNADDAKPTPPAPERNPFDPNPFESNPLDSNPFDSNPFD